LKAESDKRASGHFWAEAATLTSLHDIEHAIAVAGLKMRYLLLAIVFLVGTVLLLVGLESGDNLFGFPGEMIGIGTVLCVLASIAKDRIDRETTL
jgi:hypothetical protein